MTAGRNDHAAALAQRADGALVELATAQSPNNSNTMFGIAVVVPHSSEPVDPPLAKTPAEEPVTPVSAITAPRRGSSPRRVTVLRGTARGRLRIERVDVALVRRTDRRCMYLKTAAPTWRRGRLGNPMNPCAQLIWKRAAGTRAWSFRFKRPLPKGSYLLYSRAHGGDLTEAPPQRMTFRVR